MYFEGRDLNAFSEPVSSGQLKTGQVYFLVGFIDDKMLVPMLEAYVFIGRNLKPQDQDRLYFQTFVSHKQGLTWSSSSPDDGHEFLCQPEDQLGMLFEYEHALNELLKCSLRRKKVIRGTG
jgi:hypothetical protein